MTMMHKMLQKIEQRGLALEIVRPSYRQKTIARPILLGAATVGVILIAGLSWRHVRHPAPSSAAVTPVITTPAATLAIPAAPPVLTISTEFEPAAPRALAPDRERTAMAPKQKAGNPRLKEMTMLMSTDADAVKSMERTPDAVKAPATAALIAESAPAVAIAVPVLATPATPVSPVVAVAAEAVGSSAPIPVAPTLPIAPISTLTATQRAENTYRRALVSLQEGRVAEAMASLQQTLVINAQHTAARQTLIRLLLENNRTDDASRQLQQALALDAAQPGMAMMLARLQLDKGGPAVETLMRTLPFATENGEFQAFLGAALQRHLRPKEAAEHYELALQTAPQNGMWWIGLGLAMQAQHRQPEAIDAFTRAKASPNLGAPMQAFVDRKLQQLGQ